ncbi:MAG: LemA family protein [Dehalococcoidia bacterium]
MPTLLIVLGVIAVLVVIVIALYNGLVQRKLRVDEAWAQIDVQLKRRHDLIPNLVNAVKDYMGFEQDVLTRITQARAGAIAASSGAAAAAGAAGVAQVAQAENQLSQALRGFFATVENYPDLKANQNVMSLQEELSTTENQISFSRQHFNAVVRDYNQAIQQFPGVIFAGMLGFGRREFFEVEETDRAVPEVRLR